MTTRLTHGSTKWTALVLFWFIYFMNQADRQVLFSVFPLVQKEFGLSDAHLGLLGSVFFWMYAALVPVAGALGDKLSRKNIIVFALLVWSASTATSGLVGGFTLLLVFRALTGTGEALYYPAANSILSDYHGRSTRALAMSIHQTSVYLGIVGSGTLAGYVGQVYGWRMAFVAFGGLGILLAAITSRVLVDPVRGAAEDEGRAEPAPAPPVVDQIRHAASSGTFWTLMAAFLCFKLVDAAYLSWMPTLLYRKFSLSLMTAGFHATFWHHVGAFAGVLMGGRLSDRWALRSVIARPMVQVTGLVLGAPFIYLLGVSPDRTIVYGALTLFGFFRGLYDSNLFASLYEVVRPESRATATGMMLCAAFLGGGCAPLLIGFLSRTLALGQAMAFTSVLYLAGAAIILAGCGLWFRRDSARIHRALPLVLENS